MGYQPTIEGVPIVSSTVVNGIEFAYPNTLKSIVDNKLYAYLTLFAIRISTCDTGQPDDWIGGIRLMPSATGDYWQMELSHASVDPSPNYLRTTFDAQSKAKGGTAWFKEGKYPYYLIRYQSYPAFAPTKNIPVWRWNQKTNGEYFSEFAYGGQGGGVINSNGVEVETGNVAIQSDVTDTLIHRSWSRIIRDDNGNIISGKFTNDSAGCQVFENNSGLITLEKWAKEHLKKQNYPNTFMYCLINKNQFIQGQSSGYSKENGWEVIRRKRQDFYNIFSFGTNLEQ
jgi:hypothetical protein